MTNLKTKIFSGGALLMALAAVGVSQAADLAPQTRQNLETAMHGEAYANLKYRAYAEAARQHGDADLARLFEETANVEANEHFARESDALKLASFDAQNLANALAGENYENTKMYIEFADQAERAGDRKVAALFREIAADEGDHYQKFQDAFVRVTSHSQPTDKAAEQPSGGQPD